MTRQTVVPAEQTTVATVEEVSGELVNTIRFYQFGAASGDQLLAVSPGQTIAQLLVQAEVPQALVTQGEVMVNGVPVDDLTTPVEADSLVVFTHKVRGGK